MSRFRLTDHRRHAVLHPGPPVRPADLRSARRQGSDLAQTALQAAHIGLFLACSSDFSLLWASKWASHAIVVPHHLALVRQRTRALPRNASTLLCPVGLMLTLKLTCRA
jgi:hypothetical protein